MNSNYNFYGFGKLVILTEEDRPNQLQEGSSGNCNCMLILVTLATKIITLYNLEHANVNCSK